MKDEKEYYKRFLGKHIKTILKFGENKIQYYQGEVIEIFEDKLMLDDRKLGKIPIGFEGLTILDISERGFQNQI